MTFASITERTLRTANFYEMNRLRGARLLLAALPCLQVTCQYDFVSVACVQVILVRTSGDPTVAADVQVTSMFSRLRHLPTQYLPSNARRELVSRALAFDAAVFDRIGVARQSVLTFVLQMAQEDGACAQLVRTPLLIFGGSPAWSDSVAHSLQLKDVEWLQYLVSEPESKMSENLITIILSVFKLACMYGPFVPTSLRH